MPKGLCIVGMVVSALLLLIFGLDLATSMLLDSGFPFDGVSPMMDVAFVLASGILGYLSWATLREQA